MNKQQILEQIDELKQKIEELKKKVTSPEFEGVKKGVRQKPECGVVYFYLKHDGYIGSTHWGIEDTDLFRFNTGNCFKTEQEAKDYKENLLTKQALKDLALELNNGVEIDWDDFYQEKYRIFSVGGFTDLEYEYVGQTTDTGQVYCLNENFLTIAKDRIGEEKLIKLIKSGV